MKEKGGWLLALDIHSLHKINNVSFMNEIGLIKMDDCGDCKKIRARPLEQKQIQEEDLKPEFKLKVRFCFGRD